MDKLKILSIFYFSRAITAAVSQFKKCNNYSVDISIKASIKHNFF